MISFNSMTIVAACRVLGGLHSHADLENLELEWGIDGRCSGSSKPARSADLARLTMNENPEVLTVNGRVKLDWAIIEKAINAPPHLRDSEDWKKLVAGLRFDGFEINEIEMKGTNPWDSSTTKYSLRRMYPGDVPQLDFKESESEVFALLKEFEFSTSKEHLKQALNSFLRGDWASANAQLRTFYESYFDEMAKGLGYTGKDDSRERRNYLGSITPSFLAENLNEWNVNAQKPQFVQGLLARMHPEGSHPGLSGEDDCTFRLHITLITSRLFLRRYKNRKKTPHA